MTAPGLFLARLRLTDFRSWLGLDARFDASLICIAGENGAGKTNLLEAISLLAPGRGLRGARMGEVGRQEAGAGLPWAVAGRFETRAGPMDIGTGTEPEGATVRPIYRLDWQALRSQAMLAELGRMLSDEGVLVLCLPVTVPVALTVVPQRRAML